MNIKIAYLVNRYPAVSHSFIRREILALERQGMEVLRYSVRGWSEPLFDEADISERKRTRYLLKDGWPALLRAVIAVLCARPGRLAAAFALAVRVSRRSTRSLPYHLAYLCEACRLLRSLEREGVDHVHAHFGTNSAEIAMLTRALGGAPYSFTVHGPEEFDKPEFLSLREKIARSAFVVGVSSFGRSQLLRWCRYEDWSKVQVVHCGLDETFLRDGAGSEAPDSETLVCIGRLVEQKGQLLLVDAAAELARRGVRFRIVLLGDGEMREEIESRIEQHSLGERFALPGSVSNEVVRSTLLESRGLVLPSFAEGLPVVIMEAMALRRPVTTTCIAGIPELVLHRETGWLVPAGAVEELADAMQEHLTAPVTALREMADAARMRVRERHTIDTEAAKLAALIRNCSGDAIAPGDGGEPLRPDRVA